MAKINDEIITYDEYNNSLSSFEYIDLVKIMKSRLTIDNDTINKIISI